MAALIDSHVQVFSAANVTSLTSASWTIAGSNRQLYHQVGSGASSVANPTSTKIGGSGGTALSVIGTTQDLGANGKHTLYALTAPSAGSTTSYAEWPGNQDETFLIAVSTKDTDQATPNNTVASATGTNVSPTASATSVSGDLVLGFMFYLDSGANAATWTRGGQTVLETIRDASTPYEGMDAAYQTAAGTSTAASWSVSGTGAIDEWGVFALAVNAAVVVSNSVSSRRGKPTIHPGAKPGPFGARLRTRRYNTPAPLPTITGTLATTNANDTLSAAGSPVSSGTLATTNANDTAAAAGMPTVNGSAGATNANDTLAASGIIWAQAASRRAKTPIHPGAGPYNLLRFKRTARNNTVAALSVTGSAAVTNTDDTLSAAGSPTVNGSASPTNGNDTLSAAGTTTVIGTLAKTNANDTVAAAGTTAVTGSAAPTNANDTLAASGFLPTTGTLAVTNGNDTLSAAGVATSAQTGGGAVIVDLPKKRGRKSKKAADVESEAIKPTADHPRVISEEEATGMAALYSGIESRPAPEVAKEPEEIAEIEDVSEPILPDEIGKMLFAAQAIQPEKVDILPELEDEIDEIALILAIIEAIG